MSPSSSIGRIGGLAAALGVGAAVLAVPGVAWADPDTASSSSSGSTSDTARSVSREVRSSAAASSAAPSRSNAGSRTRSRTVVTVRGSEGGGKARASLRSAGLLASRLDPSPATAVIPDSAASSIQLPALSDTSVSTTPAAASTLWPETVSRATASATSNSVATTHGLATAVATAANNVSSTVGTVVDHLVNLFSSNSPLALFAAARRQLPGAASSASQATAAEASPLLVLNGYNVVPTSTVDVVSFYGMYTHWPSFSGVVQGTQSFDLVDPATGQTVGSFDALVGYHNSFGGSSFKEIVVTDVLSGAEGAKAGETPPVGSVISAVGDPRLQTVYSAMPTQTGYAVAYKLVTALGTLPLPTLYNAAKNLTDDGLTNKPMAVGKGFYIAPETPSTQTLISASGFPPYFTAVQGSQTFSMYDKDDNPVGSFEGLVTSTSDFAGIYTKAILVTANDGGPDVGTGVGQVPPVGSVYNVIYFWNDKTYIFYSSKPSSPKDVIRAKIVAPLGVTWLLPTLNASSPPPIKSLKVPGGYTFVPVSELQPIGINGLPPREVIIQGYQQYDVYDSTGTKIGSFDADVSRQWDNQGAHTEALLVTKVTEGTPGVTAGAIPPVGSVFNFNYAGIPGFSEFNSAMPGPEGDLIANVVVTPLTLLSPNAGFIPVWTPYDAAKDLAGYTYVNPFA